MTSKRASLDFKLPLQTWNIRPRSGNGALGGSGGAEGTDAMATNGHELSPPPGSLQLGADVTQLQEAIGMVFPDLMVDYSPESIDAETLKAEVDALVAKMKSSGKSATDSNMIRELLKMQVGQSMEVLGHIIEYGSWNRSFLSSGHWTTCLRAVGQNPGLEWAQQGHLSHGLPPAQASWRHAAGN